MNAIVLVAIVGGFYASTFAARYNATLVNGILLLILIGTVLGNADKWMPYLTALGEAGTPAVSTSQQSPPQTLVGAGG